MGDESGQATVVSNSSSRESFAGLVSHDASGQWDYQAGSRSITMSEPQTNQDNSITPQSSSPNLTSTIPSTFPSTLIVSKTPLPILPSAGLAVSAAPANNTVPEFLYQLTKMLTGGHNDIIEWSNGRIEVHNPHKLESTVLQKYFRHSKFASFQRQLNYFGFRKLAGKGKMAPCSYVNEAATQDIGSLLLIKRKTTTTPKDKNGRKQAAEKHAGKAVHVPLNTARGVAHQVKTAATPANISYGARAATEAQQPPVANSQQAIAQSAVGRGIRHSFSGASTAAATAAAAAAAERQPAPGAPTEPTAQFLIPTRVEDSLSQLASNYQNSLVDLPTYPEQPVSNAQPQAVPGPLTSQAPEASYRDPFPSLLSRNSSLVDLAMIPSLEGDGDGVPTIPGMSFVDFPQPEVDPSKYRAGVKQEDQHQSG